ncbi:MAG: CBS domain-containing protein [Candidatus Methanomethyliaceae archaeon]|nr:CBS domain-containing protein [Candidatus Methanomethyliaceae archaeon]
MKKVKNIMSKKVIKADKKSSVYNISKMMDENGIGSIVITDGNKATGMVTERDIITKCLAKGCDPKKMLAERIMSTPLVSIEQDCDVVEAAKLMVSKMIRRLPVIDKGDLKGMVTTTDMIREVVSKGKRKEDSLIYIVCDYEKF